MLKKISPQKAHRAGEEIRDSPCLKDLALSRRIGAQSVFDAAEICELRLHAVTCRALHYVEKQHRTNNEPQNRIKSRSRNLGHQGILVGTRFLQSFATIKNTGHKNFVISRFHTRARNGLTGLCTVAPCPRDTPSPIFFWGEGAAVHRLSEMDNRSSNCPSKLMDKVRRIVHSKLKLFHFQIKTYYLSDANHQTDPICCNFCMVLSMFFRLVLTRGMTWFCGC